jgi:hypothetical protein
MIHLQVLGSNLEQVIAYPDWDLSCIPQSLQEKSAVVSRLRHDRFLPNPYQLISNPTIRRYTCTVSKLKTSLNTHKNDPVLSLDIWTQPSEAVKSNQIYNED